MKTCKYENCNKEIKDHRRSYCDNNNECYLKQQVIDQALYREKRRSTKPTKMNDCKNPNCEEKFPHAGQQKYCSPQCRKDYADNHKEIPSLEKKKPLKDLPEWMVKRGKIHYEGYVA